CPGRAVHENRLQREVDTSCGLHDRVRTSPVEPVASRLDERPRKFDAHHLRAQSTHHRKLALEVSTAVGDAVAFAGLAPPAVRIRTYIAPRPHARHRID